MIHVACRILLSPKPCLDLTLKAKQRLIFYAHQFGAIYDAEHMVYNVYSLIHLADDCIYFKCSLNDLSSFPFENMLGKVKRMIQKRGKHLAQLYKRLGELNNRPLILRQSKFDNVKTLGLHCIIPISARDNICMISPHCIIEVK